MTQEWLEEGGVPADTAAAWTSAAFGAFAADSAGATAQRFAELLAEQTPGGLNEILGSTLSPVYAGI